MIGARLAEPRDVLRIDVRSDMRRPPDVYRNIADCFDALGESWTFTRTNGSVLMVCGLKEAFPGRAMAWSMVADERPWRDMMLAGAMIARMIDERLVSQYHRIEAYCDIEPLDWHLSCDWWLRRLGFEPEGILRSYTMDARDQGVYARVRGDG